MKQKQPPATDATGQEWTPEWLANYGDANDWLQSICDAHNAALAAERENRKWEREQLTAEIKAARQQLAAERATG